LFVAVSALLHARSLSASYLLKFQMVRKYPGRSEPQAADEHWSGDIVGVCNTQRTFSFEVISTPHTTEQSPIANSAFRLGKPTPNGIGVRDCRGLRASVDHPQNGMQESDMWAALACAATLDEVIMFRSTGPWSRHWIERGWPTKSFHIKGKSADWGPQAGLIPYDGIYSKMGHDQSLADKSSQENQAAIQHKYAATVELTLSYEDLLRQLETSLDRPARTAIAGMQAIRGTGDYFLSAQRSGDAKTFHFRAVLVQGSYRIMTYPEEAGSDTVTLMASPEKASPLPVMTTLEVGAGDLPLTGDYDLLSVCPRWENYGCALTSDIAAPELVFSCMKKAPPRLVFVAGTGFDKLLEMRTNTGARPSRGRRNTTFQGLTKDALHLLQEHRHMGNITPRILRCINALNEAMGAVNEKAVFRRLHHGAEADRNHLHGALTREDWEKGEGFPITVFQPPSLQAAGSPTHDYLDVSTLETFSELRTYVSHLHEAGYRVPKNWTWGMSIRDHYASL
jgi:hypothetical protein